MAGRLTERRCLIVGGTSGLGLAAAGRFLDEGARLVIAGLPDGQANAALASLQQRGPVHFIPCDASQADQVEQLARETGTLLGGLDVLYHVAGGSGRKLGDGSLHDCSDAGWQATLDLNLTSVFLTNRIAVRHFLHRRKPGVILNTASVLALSPSARYFDAVAYTAAKAGIIGLSQLAAARYASAGIRVNVLAPGLISTPMAVRATGDPLIADFLCSKQPLKPGAGSPADCADAAVFLCSHEAAFITGVVLPVDGGWRLSDGQYGRDPL